VNTRAGNNRLLLLFDDYIHDKVLKKELESFILDEFIEMFFNGKLIQEVKQMQILTVGNISKNETIEFSEDVV
jgi:hypothetical protein